MGRRTTRQIDECMMTGLQQKTGTCWFNSALNGLVLGYGSRIILRNFLKDYKNQNKILEIPQDSCPKDIDRSFIVNVLYKILCSRYFNPSYDVSEASYKSINAKTAKQGVAGGYPEVAFDALTKVLDLRYETVAYDTLLTHMITLPPPPSGDPEDIPPYVMVVRSAKRRGHFGMNSSQELPEEIFVHVGKGIEVYELDHCILGFNMESTGYGHAICGAFCKNDPVIFDSNRHQIVNYDWTRLTTEVPTSLQPYKVSDGSFGYSYVIYTRKVLVDYLITRPSQQVCVQQVENEYRIQTYGDGLLFLKDNKEFAYLQPSLFPPIRSFVDKDIQVRTFERIDSNKIVVATKDESVVLKVSDRHIYGMGPGGKEQPFGMLFQFPT